MASRAPGAVAPDTTLASGGNAVGSIPRPISFVFVLALDMRFGKAATRMRGYAFYRAALAAVKRPDA